MAMVVNTNVSSLIAQSAANATNKSLDTAMERLATGKRINSASDDAAGVAIASRLEAEIRGVNQAVRNAADAQAMIDTAEGAHIEITNILQRMREIAVQSSNDSNNNTDRGYLQKEVNALAAEVDRIANTSTWAGKNLIKTASSFKFLLGSEKADNEITVSTGAMTGAALGISAGNAVVGAQGAVMTEIGDNVVQFTGTPAVGDVYSMKVNDQVVEVTIANQTGADGDSDGVKDFGFTLKINGAAKAGVSGTANLTGTAAVTDFMAKAINTMEAASNNNGGLHSGLAAVANTTDSSVTVTQNVVLTAVNWDDGGTDKPGAVTTSTNTMVFSGSNGLAVGDKIKFTLGGDSFSHTIANNDAYADTVDGVVAHLQVLLNAQSDANANADAFTGYSFTVDKDGSSDIRIVVSQTAANLIKDAAATPAATTTALDVDDQTSATNAINIIDTALDTVNAQRGSLGAISNRLDSAMSNLTNMSVNLAGGKSRIEDADFASETAELTKSQILQQAATSMLAQANASKQSVLSLLQG